MKPCELCVSFVSFVVNKSHLAFPISRSYFSLRLKWLVFYEAVKYLRKKIENEKDLFKYLLCPHHCRHL